MLNLCKVAKSPNLRCFAQIEADFRTFFYSNMTRLFYITSDAVTPDPQLPEEKFSKVFYCIKTPLSAPASMNFSATSAHFASLSSGESASYSSCVSPISELPTTMPADQTPAFFAFLDIRYRITHFQDTAYFFDPERLYVAEDHIRIRTPF